jgi:hypothetical protein
MYIYIHIYIYACKYIYTISKRSTKINKVFIFFMHNFCVCPAAPHEKDVCEELQTQTPTCSGPAMNVGI